ncbi:MAG: LL-diaminopimelate aminotransferase [Spirochaetota bacterium]|nr:LL-diaminopimelate aminotransferase [Spirochaetota bacterium]
MSESYIQMLFAKRLGGNRFGKETKIYKFQKIKMAKNEALKNNPGKEILDFGVGEPDEMAFPIVRDQLKKEVDDPNNRGYSDNGISEFKYAAAKYMKNIFNADLDPETEINHTIGSKPALAMFPATLINPGDITFMTVPGYPVLGTHTIWYGGEVVNLPLTKENNFLPQLDKIPQDQLDKAKILVLNYPNNPTGANATKSFYKEVIQFAKENKIVVAQDAAYSALVYDKKPLSFLSIDGAKDVGVEFHSLSKSYNMTGWRLGFICGNSLLIKAFANVKDNIDSGQFKAIQKAGITALENTFITDEIIAKYSRRLDRFVEVLNKKGFSAKKPSGTFYLFVEAPKSVKGGIKFNSGEEFSQWLIKEKLISTVPWDDTANFVRFSATFEARGIDDETRVLNEFENRLSDVHFEF